MRVTGFRPAVYLASAALCALLLLTPFSADASPKRTDYANKGNIACNNGMNIDWQIEFNNCVCSLVTPYNQILKTNGTSEFSQCQSTCAQQFKEHECMI